ncbi:MAG TPA: hypothetical protein ENI52_01645 [Thermoplasmata archaeon]|nr:hypothetical protein [Thermoplasmata archaeon]
MNRYILSIVGATICTIAEAFLIHSIQIFFPDVYNGILDAFKDLIPLKISNTPTGLLIVISLSAVVWLIGFYLVLKEDH